MTIDFKQLLSQFREHHSEDASDPLGLIGCIECFLLIPQDEQPKIIRAMFNEDEIRPILYGLEPAIKAIIFILRESYLSDDIDPDDDLAHRTYADVLNAMQVSRFDIDALVKSSWYSIETLIQDKIFEQAKRLDAFLMMLLDTIHAEMQRDPDWDETAHDPSAFELDGIVHHTMDREDFTWLSTNVRAGLAKQAAQAMMPDCPVLGLKAPKKPALAVLRTTINIPRPQRRTSWFKRAVAKWRAVPTPVKALFAVGFIFGVAIVVTAAIVCPPSLMVTLPLAGKVAASTVLIASGGVIATQSAVSVGIVMAAASPKPVTPTADVELGAGDRRDSSATASSEYSSEDLADSSRYTSTSTDESKIVAVTGRAIVRNASGVSIYDRDESETSTSTGTVTSETAGSTVSDDALPDSSFERRQSHPITDCPQVALLVNFVPPAFRTTQSESSSTSWDSDLMASAYDADDECPAFNF